MSSVRTVAESFVRVRLTSFAEGAHKCSLSDLKLRIDTIDAGQKGTNRPKFPERDAARDVFHFETRTVAGRQVTINVFVETKQNNHTATISIETLIRDADKKIREYTFTEKGRAWMSVELIAPKDIRETRYSERDVLRNHYGHEFLSKYFTRLPAFCTICKTIIWGFNNPGFRCQLCDLVVHEHCMDQVVFCKQISRLTSVSPSTITHNFIREPNFLPIFCDHDGRIISPLAAWKCSECKMIVHGKCKEKVVHFCGIRKEAIEMYNSWKEKNQPTSIDTYLYIDDHHAQENLEQNQKLLMDIHDRLQSDQERSRAIEDLNAIKKLFRSSEGANQNSHTSYYNRSAILLHRLKFQSKIGRGMSGSIYLVKDSTRSFAMKALRKHRVLEGNEFESVKRERDILISSRHHPFIIHVYAVFHDFERIYFLLEYAPCGAFYDFLLRCGENFDEPCIQWFSGQIICALSYLHSQLIIHRDLKPENVLLMRDGRLKLADFGFAKTMKSKLDVTRTFCGTLEYIAPEIYQRLNYSFPVDYWSLGVMIYEMRVLKTPFYHASEGEIRAHVLTGDIQWPATFSADFQDLVSSLLKRNPKDRYGVDDIRSHKFYSSPYSIEEIERSKTKCPWKKPIPLLVPHEPPNSSTDMNLSRIDEEALCATYTLTAAKFRGFSFEEF